MDIKQLQYFVTIVEEGTITAAAKKLVISQPPLSYQMKLLEEELNVKLMDRGPRKITLTEAGKALYKKATNILDLTEKTIRELDDISKGIQGTLSLGTISSSGGTLLTSRMSRFHEIYPNIRFDIHEGDTYSLIDALKSGITEVCIVRTPFSTEGLNYTTIEKEPMVAVGLPAFFEEIEGDSISVKQLGDKPLIYYKRFEMVLMPVFERNNIKLEFFCRTIDARSAFLWAAAGLGVAIIPKSLLVIMNRGQVTSKIIDEDELYTKVVAVWKKNQYLSSIAQKFVEFFKSY